MTTATTSNTANTAAAAYARQHRDISALLSWITDEVEGHAERAEAGRINWGHVGDIGSLRGFLLDALETISGTSRTDIERELNEL